jgi:cell wall-associated NlpC family hydrolase
MEWDKYIGLPFKHLGIDPTKGIDCFNLIQFIYKDKLDINIPYTTRDWCNIIDENWYFKTHERLMDIVTCEKYGWQKVQKIEKYNMIIMMLGSSNVNNHAALYIGQNKILHIMPNHKSHISVYGNYYKQYTTGCFKWIGTTN